MKVKIAYYREDREIDIPEKNLIGVLRPKEIQPPRTSPPVSIKI